MGAAKRNAIVFATDRTLFPVAVYQATQLASLGLPASADIVIATESVEDLRLAIDSGVSFRPFLLDPDWVAHLPMRESGHVTRATFYRFFLPRLLGEDYRRLLYLDVDIHVHSSRLFALFDIAMDGHAIGAVRDLLPFRGDGPAERELRATVSGAHRKYLNAGVLLIDPVAFAEQDLETRLLAIARQRKLHFQDQSAVNTVLDGNWLELSQSFNMFVELWDSYVPKVCEPVLVHFVGATKPWHGPRFTIAHPAKRHMERYFAGSQWPNFLAQFYSFKDAWQLVHRPPAQQEARRQGAMSGAFMHYMYSTRFADVDQGVTALRLDAMPGVRLMPATPEPTSPA